MSPAFYHVTQVLLEFKAVICIVIFKVNMIMDKNKKENENNTNTKYHYGKKFFFKEKNEKTSEYQQMGEESCRVLLKALFEEKPKEQTKTNKKQKKKPK